MSASTDELKIAKRKPLKLYIMNVAELIEQLKKLPQDLPLRMVDENNDEENFWVYGVDFSSTGDLGYEVSGEVRLLVSE